MEALPELNTTAWQVAPDGQMATTFWLKSVPDAEWSWNVHEWQFR